MTRYKILNCNLCGWQIEQFLNTKRVDAVGLERLPNSTFKIVPVADTDIHICASCFAGLEHLIRILDKLHGSSEERGITT